MVDGRSPRFDKWRKIYERDQGWSTPRHQQIKERESEIAINWLVKSHPQPGHPLKILEVGCGDGYLGRRMLSASSLKIQAWVFTDLLDECIQQARKNNEHDVRAEYQVMDAYALHQAFPAGSFDVVISTGFASAATYKEVVPNIAHLLPPEGLLIADFVNHLAFPIWPNLWKNIQKYRQGAAYHLGIHGIHDFFRRHGLTLIESREVPGQWGSIILCLFRREF